MKASKILKHSLIDTTILRSPILGESFDLKGDTSKFSLGVFLWQKVEEKTVAIYYESMIQDEAQITCATKEKELLLWSLIWKILDHYAKKLSSTMIIKL